GGRDLLSDVVHVAAHGTAARARPVTASCAENDDPRIHNLSMEEVLLGPRGDILPRIEISRASFGVHELLESHWFASNVGRQKNLFASSASVSNRVQAHDRSDGDEDEGEEPQAEGHIRCEEGCRSSGECHREVDEDFVQHEQDHAESYETNPAPGAAMPMDDRRRGHGCAASDRCRGGSYDGGPLRLREIRRRVSPTGITPPPLILRNPAEGRATGRAGKLGSRLRRIRAAWLAVP